RRHRNRTRLPLWSRGHPSQRPGVAMTTFAPALARAARDSLPALAAAAATQRDRFLQSLAQRLRDDMPALLAANADDLARALELPDSLRERLLLNPARIQALATAVEA